MKTCRSLFLVAATAFLFAACGKNESSTTSGAAASGPREIELTANDTMKFSTTALEAKPGESLKVILTNNGSIPKEVMGHNWVLLKSGVDAVAFDSAASTAKATDYLPPGREGDILAHIELLGPRKSGEVSFTAPTTPGDYTFLCTFPAHYQAGMHGILTVK